jgi:hypothetical protein
MRALSPPKRRESNPGIFPNPTDSAAHSTYRKQGQETSVIKQSKVWGALRLMLLTLSLATAGTTALAVAPAALATNEPYSCESCTATNGAVNYVQNVTGTDYTRSRVCVDLWNEALTEAHGGCTEMSHSYVCLVEGVYGHFKGHGETTNWNPNKAEHMSGRETNYPNFPEECK